MSKQNKKKEWIYSDIVKNHFFSPRNILLREPKPGEFDAEGVVGNPACGDVMKMWIKFTPTKASGGDPMKRRVKKLKWRTFGCASAIASTSMFSQMVTEKGGMKLADALKITPQDIMKRLGGLPPYKVHCSVLADQAFKATVNNYLKKDNQTNETRPR
jgi:NifU-like protein involved in Fe-S cluster formation